MFRNPGTLRVPAEHALQGGESDCRNRTLHQLFLQLGLGERAGSGLPKIRAAWEPMGYAIRLYDSFEPYDQSILEMKRVGQPGSRSEEMSGETGEMSGEMSEKTTGSEKSSEKVSEETGASSENHGDAPVNAPVNAPVSSLQGMLLEWIRQDPRVSYDKLAELASKDRTTIMRNLARLKDLEKLRRIGPNKGGHWEVLP